MLASDHSKEAETEAPTQVEGDSQGGEVSLSDKVAQETPKSDQQGFVEFLNTLQVVDSPQDPTGVLASLRALSKAGRLPGYEQRSGGTFECAIFGGLFDRTLRGRIEASASGSKITMRVTLDRKVPAILLAALVFSIWPGVWLLHSLLTTYFGWYPNPEWVTWAWYIPLTLLGLPVLWKQFRAARAAAAADLLEVLQKVKAATERS
ncbi:MAG: hypothetical protein AAGB34_01875 [Planctomycetota bacterium]